MIDNARTAAKSAARIESHGHSGQLGAELASQESDPATRHYAHGTK